MKKEFENTKDNGHALFDTVVFGFSFALPLYSSFSAFSTILNFTYLSCKRTLLTKDGKEFFGITVTNLGDRQKTFALLSAVELEKVLDVFEILSKRIVGASK